MKHSKQKRAITDPGLGYFSWLPRELRDQIYADYFEKAEITSARWAWHDNPIKFKKCYPRGLLSVSTAMYAEAKPFEYHDLTVVFSKGQRSLSLGLALQIRNIRFAEAAVPQMFINNLDISIFPRLQNVSYAPLDLCFSVYLPYKWLEHLLQVGCTKQFAESLRSQLRVTSMRAILDASPHQQNASDGHHSVSAIVPCRVVHPIRLKPRTPYVDIHLHLEVRPFRVVYVQREGFLYPTPDCLDDQLPCPPLGRGCAPPQKVTQPSMAGLSAWNELNGVERTAQEKPDENLDRLLSRQERRFPWIEKDRFRAVVDQHGRRRARIKSKMRECWRDGRYLIRKVKMSLWDP